LFCDSQMAFLIFFSADLFCLHVYLSQVQPESCRNLAVRSPRQFNHAHLDSAR
jgi:hypothetical protein